MNATSTARLRVYTTMATWCAPCVEELPHLQRLRSVFDPGDVVREVISVDLADGPEALAAYVDYHGPAYDLLTALSPEEIDSV